MSWPEHLFHPSDWEITGSAGASSSASIEILQGGIGHLRLYLHNTRSGDRITVSGTLIEAGLGRSPAGAPPVSGSASIPEFPSTGLGRVLVGPACDGSLRAGDFAGQAGVIEIAASAMWGASICAIFFLRWWELAAQGALALVSAPNPILAACASYNISITATKAVGFVAGIIGSAGFGAGITGGRFFCSVE